MAGGGMVAVDTALHGARAGASSAQRGRARELEAAAGDGTSGWDELAEDLSSSSGDELEGGDGGGEATTALSLVGEGLTAITAELAACFPALRRLCLHGNSISSLAGLSGLSGLQELNLSSNSIAGIADGALRGLGQLTALSLASNCLAELGGGALAGLTRLRRLSLAHNSLASLAGLAALHGGQLEQVDLRDNALASLADFSVLAGLPRLAELHVAGGAPGAYALQVADIGYGSGACYAACMLVWGLVCCCGKHLWNAHFNNCRCLRAARLPPAGNPVCQQPQYRLAVAAALPHLKQLDGRPISPGEAMQYLAALQLQAFQPAALAGVARQLGQTPQAAGEGALPVAPAAGGAGGAGGQHTAQLHAERQQSADGTSAAATVQRIQQALASFGSTAGPSSLVQQHQQQAQQERRGSGSPEEELHSLLRDCPQLAGVISSALQQVGQPASRRQPQDVAAGKPQADRNHHQQPQHEPAVLRSSIAVQTEPAGEGSAAVAAASAAAEQEQQQRVVALQDEVAALQAELEVQAQAAQRAQQDAAEVSQQSQRLVALAEQAAEQRVAGAQQQAAAALEQANQELSGMQVGGQFSSALWLHLATPLSVGQPKYHVHALPPCALQGECAELAVNLKEAQAGAAAGQRRQQELEYELARAWQELDSSEAAHQAEQQRAAAEGERLAAELERSRAGLAAAQSELASARQEATQQRQLVERLQVDGAAAGSESSRRLEQVTQELAAAQSQLAERQQQVQEVAGREREAALQLRQLSATLAAVHEEHEAALAALRQEQQRELQAGTADCQAAVASAQQERDELQRRLAATEAEFRCALQVWHGSVALDLGSSHPNWPPHLLLPCPKGALPALWTD